MILDSRELELILSELPPGPRMPAVFIGHGSPTNALADNAFTRALAQLGARLSTELPAPPAAILVVSAHWQTSGVYVQSSIRPETIHDFGGFPQELYRIQYPAPGSPQHARVTAKLTGGLAQETTEWGLDHGAWTVLRHVFPDARIPVYQMSIDWLRTMAFHFDLAKMLAPLRDRGVLIVGSGNIVHNLRQSMPRFMTGDARPFDWAVSFDAWVKQRLEARDFGSLIRFQEAGESALLSVPTPDHYVPLLYTMGVAEPAEAITQVHEEVCFGGISMRTFRID